MMMEGTLKTTKLPLGDKLLPPVIREIVTNAPASRKIPAFIASLAPLCALACRIRAKYWHDTDRLHALLLQVILEGQQSAGKSFASSIESLVMKNTLKARDNMQRRLEQEYREMKKRRGANQKLDEEPKTTIRVIPPTISKTVLTRRADLYQRILGDTMTFWMFSDELSMVTDASKQGYSNLRTIMRTAYDLGSEFGLDYASDNSYSAIVDINICSMFCATPSALAEYYDHRAIEGSNITRCIICPVDDSIDSDTELFLPYTDRQRQIIDERLAQMMTDSYTPDNQLQPTKLLDTAWIDEVCKKFIADKAKEYSLTGNEAVKVFRKRSSVSAFRAACLCYYLYSLEDGFDPCLTDENSKAQKRAQDRCRKLYIFLAEFIMEQMLNHWGQTFNELSGKRVREGKSDKMNLFDRLSDEFTRDQLTQLISELGCTTPARQFLWIWGPKKMKVIQMVDKDHFKKIKI